MLARFKDLLERRYLPETESVPISRDALKTLRAWGFTRLQVKELQKIVEELDGAYLNCLTKIEAMPVLQKQGRETIIVPHFNEGDHLPVGGSCREITDLVLRRIMESGLLEIINRRSKESIEPRIVKGTNSSHFKDSGHVWGGLVRMSNPEEMVVLDASYQEITHMRSNGYTLWFMDHPSDVKKATSTELLISCIDISSTGIDVRACKERVLGLSTDKSVSFAIGFATQSMESSSQHFNTLFPFIRVGGTSSRDDAIFLLNPGTNEINSVYKNGSFKLTDSTKQELRSLLLAASSIQFVEMPEKLI